MSNLGLYQEMTTLAKKLGGPLQLCLAVAVGGYAVIRTGEAGTKKIFKTVKKRAELKKFTSEKLFVVHSDGKSNEGLVFRIGDKFRVLEIDNNAVLIEKLGDSNNPYFVSAELLRSISDFEN